MVKKQAQKAQPAASAPKISAPAPTLPDAPSPQTTTTSTPTQSPAELADEDLNIDYSGLDRTNPTPSFLQEPAMIAPYHRLAEQHLIDLYKANAGKKDVVVLGDKILDSIQNILIDSFTASLGEAIYATFDEQGDGDKKAAVHQCINELASTDINSFLINREQNKIRGDKNIQKEVQRILSATPDVVTVKFGSGNLAQNPLVLPPLRAVAAAGNYKLDVGPAQAFLHLWSVYSPTSFDIHKGVDLSNTTVVSSKDRPAFPAPKSLPPNTQIKLINDTDYYLSQAILREFPIILSKSSTKPSPDEFVQDFLQQLDPSTPTPTPSGSARSPPGPSAQHISTTLATFSPIADAAGMKTHVIFYDSLTKNYYNVTNKLFTPAKTQLMYAMVLGASVDVINSILILGVNILQTDENGWTAIRWALERVLKGRTAAFEAFGIMGYLQPLHFGETSPVTPAATRLGDSVGEELAKTINAAQGFKGNDKYIKYDLQLPKPSKSTTNPHFQADFELFLQYVDAINQHVRKSPTTYVQLFQSNQASTAHIVPDEADLFVTELINPSAASTSTSTPTPTTTKKDKKAEKKDDVSKHLYRYTGGISDDSLSELLDFMMINTTTACYMLNDEKNCEAALKALGSHYTTLTWEAIQQRSDSWYTYPDMTEELKEATQKRLQTDRQQLVEQEAQLKSIKSERDTLQKQYAAQQEAEKAAGAELQVKQKQLEAVQADCAKSEKQIEELKKRIAEARKKQTGLQSAVIVQPVVPQKETKGKKAKSPDTASNPPIILEKDGVYQATLSPGAIEPFSIKNSLKQQTRDLVTTLLDKKSIPDELLDQFKLLPDNIDVSSTNPDPYQLFCTLYQSFVTEQPARITDANDVTFNTEQEHLLSEYFRNDANRYQSEIDFWKGLLANRAGLLHAAMIRMYQLEVNVRKYKSKIYQLIEDVQYLEGRYAVIRDLPKNVEFVSQMSSKPEQESNIIVNGMKFDNTIPSNNKLNLCIKCHKAPKEVITTCCFTLIACQSCISTITTCPQCHKKGVESKTIKFH